MNSIDIIYQNSENDKRNINLINTIEILILIQRKQNKFLNLFVKIMINEFHDFSFI